MTENLFDLLDIYVKNDIFKLKTRMEYNDVLKEFNNVFYRLCNFNDVYCLSNSEYKCNYDEYKKSVNFIKQNYYARVW